MGLLDFYNDPQQMAMLGLASGLLQAGGPSRTPVSFGQGIGQGLLQGAQMGQSAAQNRLAQTYLGEQIKQMQAANERQAQMAPILQRFAGRLQGPQGASQGNPMVPGQAGSQVPTGGPGASQGLPFSLEDISLLKLLGGPDLTSAYTASRPNLAVEGGFMIDRHRGVVGSVPQTNQQGFSTMTVPDPSGGYRVQQVPGAAEAYGTQQRIGAEEQARYDLVDVPLSDGRTVKMPRLDAARMLAAPRAAPGPAVPAPRSAAPFGGGGQFGVSQSPGQRVASETAARAGAEQGVTGSPGQQAADRKFGEEYAAFQAGGGFADAQKNIVQLEQQLNALKTEGGLTGKSVGLTPDKAMKYTNPRAAAVKQQIEEVVQRNLRLILGAQFTEREGERLISRAYDDALPQPENAARIDRLLAAMKAGLNAKQEAAAYFEANGTLRGWGGKVPTIRDFMQAVEDGGQSVSGEIKIPKGVTVRRLP